MKKIVPKQPFISYILLLIISSIFICVDIFGNSLNIEEPKSKAVDVEKLTLETGMHENPGGPENSDCNQATGKKFSKWYQFLKSSKNNTEIENYIKSEGMPAPAWSTIEKYHDQEMAFWDSRCLAHRQKNNKIYEAILFPKGVLQDSNELFWDDLFVMLSPDNITKYQIPRNERPIYLDGIQIVYIKEENDRYLGIKLDAQGNISITDLITPAELPQLVDCPDLLKNQFKAEKNNKKLYHSYQCQTIWNIQSKKSAIIMYYLACI